jgi:hypothetical protein
MAKSKKTIAEIELKPKKKGGFIRFVLILVVILLLITLLRRSFSTNGEKTGS